MSSATKAMAPQNRWERGQHDMASQATTWLGPLRLCGSEEFTVSESKKASTADLAAARNLFWRW